MSNKHSQLIPHYLEAPSPKGLRRSMIKNNLENGKQYTYFDISQYKDKRGQVKWIAWYLEEYDVTKELR